VVRQLHDEPKSKHERRRIIENNIVAMVVMLFLIENIHIIKSIVANIADIIPTRMISGSTSTTLKMKLI